MVDCATGRAPADAVLLVPRLALDASDGSAPSGWLESLECPPLPESSWEVGGLRVPLVLEAPVA